MKQQELQLYSGNPACSPAMKISRIRYAAGQLLFEAKSWEKVAFELPLIAGSLAYGQGAFNP